MVGDFVPKDNMYWENYLTMLKITAYIFAPEITEDEVCYVKLLIEEHHSNFSTLYPTASIIPKMHYLIHMPRLILR